MCNDVILQLCNISWDSNKEVIGMDPRKTLRYHCDRDLQIDGGLKHLLVARPTDFPSHAFLIPTALLPLISNKSQNPTQKLINQKTKNQYLRHSSTRPNVFSVEKLSRQQRFLCLENTKQRSQSSVIHVALLLANAPDKTMIYYLLLEKCCEETPKIASALFGKSPFFIKNGRHPTARHQRRLSAPPFVVYGSCSAFRNGALKKRTHMHNSPQPRY